jgi:hypothetical protein
MCLGMGLREGRWAKSSRSSLLDGDITLAWLENRSRRRKKKKKSSKRKEKRTLIVHRGYDPILKEQVDYRLLWAR